MIDSISVLELKKLKNINIIDIRSIEKYNHNHINNSINIPFEQLILHFNEYLNKNKKYYIYCQKGIQSRKMCEFLRNNGYNVINILGGYEKWILSE